MEGTSRMKELYKSHRPKKTGDVIGQDAAVKTITAFFVKDRLPQTLLFSGPSGTGKTTLARIVRRELKCSKIDFYEINGSDKNGIDDMRYIRSQLHKAPFKGKCKVWLIDEAHKISSAAQDMILTMLEDTPKNVYFMLATTDPLKLKKPIRTRATEIKLKLIGKPLLKTLVKGVVKKEKAKVPAPIIDAIVENAEGSARKALVLLNQVYLLDDKKEMLAAMEETTLEKAAEFIGRLLINPRTSWPAMAKCLKDNAQEDPESIRWGVLGYARNCLLSGGRVSGRAALIIDAFSDNFYDSKHAGLAIACYDVICDESSSK
jgi:DNA polymerase III gamma/tau subunit